MNRVKARENGAVLDKVIFMPIGYCIKKEPKLLLTVTRLT